MERILSGYLVDNATWFYLSLFLIVAVYFRFSRFFSLRNLDLLVLLSISPGILLAQQNMPAGYVWLFCVSGVLLLRLICDGYFTRRPRLDQNLNTQGLTFLGVVAFVFLSATACNSNQIPASTVQTVEAAERLWNRQEPPNAPAAQQKSGPEEAKAGPAATVLTAPIVQIQKVAANINPAPKTGVPGDFAVYTARLASIVAHLAVVIALVLIGRWHLGDQSIGIAMAALYLLMPCTSYDVARINHVLPAALILWAIVAYRRPAAAGGLMGLACGTLFFPVFLLPLWVSFYDRRGARRFLVAIGVVGTILLGSFVLTSADAASFSKQVLGAIDSSVLSFGDSDSHGFWRPGIGAYRIPVFVTFCVATTVLSIWPRHKTMEQLIAHSTAIIVGTQFWYPLQGGVYALWYLPLLLIVVFRPPLAHLLPPDLLAENERNDRPNGRHPRAGELVTSGATAEASVRRGTLRRSA